MLKNIIFDIGGIILEWGNKPIQKLLNKSDEEVNKISINEVQFCFFESFSKILDDLNEKDRLIDYIYKIRYLKYLPISKNQLMKDIIDFEKLEKKSNKKVY